MAKAISNIFRELQGTLKNSEKITFRMHRKKIVIEKHPKSILCGDVRRECVMHRG